jgi:putative membrane protein
MRFTTLLAVPAAGAGPVAVAGLWHRLGAGQRLDARQAGRGAAGAGLPPCLRRVCCANSRGNQHGHVWYRWFNEAPVLMLLAAVVLVVVKPF